LLCGRARDPGDDACRSGERLHIGELRSGLHIVVVRESCSRPCAALDVDVEACLAELRDRLRDERDPMLAGSRLLRYGDSHAAANSMESDAGPSPEPLQRGPDLDLRARAADHLVGERSRAVMAPEVSGPHTVCDGFEAGLTNRPARRLYLRIVRVREQ